MARPQSAPAVKSGKRRVAFGVTQCSDRLPRTVALPEVTKAILPVGEALIQLHTPSSAWLEEGAVLPKEVPKLGVPKVRPSSAKARRASTAVARRPASAGAEVVDAGRAKMTSIMARLRSEAQRMEALRLAGLGDGIVQSLQPVRAPRILSHKKAHAQLEWSTRSALHQTSSQNEWRDRLAQAKERRCQLEIAKAARQDAYLVVRSPENLEKRRVEREKKAKLATKWLIVACVASRSMVLYDALDDDENIFQPPQKFLEKEAVVPVEKADFLSVARTLAPAPAPIMMPGGTEGRRFSTEIILSQLCSHRRHAKKLRSNVEIRKSRKYQRYLKAVNRISIWWVSLVVHWKIRADPVALGRLIRFSDKFAAAWRRRKTTNSATALRKFLETFRLHMRPYCRRLIAKVALIQVAMRDFLKVRLARLHILDKALHREERLRRDELVEASRMAELRALSRVQADDFLGARTVKLHAANVKLKKLLSLEGNSLASKRLRHFGLQNAPGAIAQGLVLYRFPSHSGRFAYLESTLRRCRRLHRGRINETHTVALKALQTVTVEEVRDFVRGGADTSAVKMRQFSAILQRPFLLLTEAGGVKFMRDFLKNPPGSSSSDVWEAPPRPRRISITASSHLLQGKLL